MSTASGIRVIRSAPAIVLAIVTAGCSGRPGAVRPPDVDSSGAASRAIEEFDRNGDGKLSTEEWAASPALNASSKTYDANSDGVLESDEIEQGIESWQSTGVGARPVPFKVQLDGRGLAGAQVRLVPAPFLGGSVKPAAGESGPGGGGSLSLAPEDMPRNAPKMPLVQPGLYAVEITHPTAKIPAKYNSETTFGMEVSSASPGPEGVVWNLKTK
jgi:hypothetical protein